VPTGRDGPASSEYRSPVVLRYSTVSSGARYEVVRTVVRAAMMNADRKPSPNMPISSSASLRSRRSRV
jgi:hypothetical protein